MSRAKQIEEMAKVIFESGVAIDGIDLAFAVVHGADMTDSHFMRIATRLYNAGYRKQSEWISVDERLPENYNECLLLLDNERIVIGWYHASAKAFVEGGIVLVNEVTHWIPLPEAPKMKGGA